MKSNIPNIVTSCNLICGCIATVFAIGGKLEMALLFIVIGAVFDFCDGLSARLLGVSSPVGKELDSLADDITFGFAPSAIIYFELTEMQYPASLECVSEYIPYVAFVLAAFSALRLAKFNLDTRQTTSFIGLPTPANALFWSALIVGEGDLFENFAYGWVVLVLMTLVSCWLLICEMPMFALKFKNWALTYADNPVKYGFIAFSIVVFFASICFEMAYTGIALVILAYILVSFIMWCIKSAK